MNVLALFQKITPLSETGTPMVDCYINVSCISDVQPVRDVEAIGDITNTHLCMSSGQRYIVEGEPALFLVRMDASVKEKERALA